MNTPCIDVTREIDVLLRLSAETGY